MKELLPLLQKEYLGVAFKLEAAILSEEQASEENTSLLLPKVKLIRIKSLAASSSNAAFLPNLSHPFDNMSFRALKAECLLHHALAGRLYI